MNSISIKEKKAETTVLNTLATLLEMYEIKLDTFSLMSKVTPEGRNLFTVFPIESINGPAFPALFKTER